MPKACVTVCDQCRRRKQKCDRQLPCKWCTQRGVADRCRYDSVSQKPTVQHTTHTSRTKDTNISDIFDKPELDIYAQIGYTPSDNGNSFSFLRQGLQLLDVSDEIPVSPFPPEEYRRLTERLIEYATVSAIVEEFFEDANWNFHLIDRQSFTLQYDTWLRTMQMASKGGSYASMDRELIYIPAMLFQLLAVSLQFLSPFTAAWNMLGLEDEYACERTAAKYSKFGLELSTLLSPCRPSVTAIQHDLIRTSWLKNCGRGSESWYSLGSAIRTAQDMKLHLEPADEPDLNEDYAATLAKSWSREKRRRLWAMLFTWDSHMSMVLGRPRTIHARDCSTKSPFECDLPSGPALTLPMAVSYMESPCIYSTALFTYRMSFLIHNMADLGAEKSPESILTNVRKLETELFNLLNSLHSALRPNNPVTLWDETSRFVRKQRLSISIIANAFLLTIYRKYSQGDDHYRDKAIRAAIDSLDAQKQFRALTLDRHFRLYYLSCYSVDACLFLAVAMLDHHSFDPYTKRRAVDALKDALERLYTQRHRSSLAKSGAAIIARCLKRIPQDPIQISPEDEGTNLSKPFRGLHHEPMATIVPRSRGLETANQPYSLPDTTTASPAPDLGPVDDLPPFADTEFDQNQWDAFNRWDPSFNLNLSDFPGIEGPAIQHFQEQMPELSWF